MRIIAISDLHGNLIKIRDKCDVVVIAGDWSPLYCQHDYVSVLSWINSKFIPWMKTLRTEHIVFIPGNHDLVCTYFFFEDELDKILDRHDMSNKVHYLCFNSIIIDGKKFYGNPNSESPNGWAFSRPYNQTYVFDNDTDILVTHQPPLVGNVGYVRQFNKELGSHELYDSIAKSNISVNICGHIHTGEHGEHHLSMNNGNTARIFNVSILDENYTIAYKPTVIEL